VERELWIEVIGLLELSLNEIEGEKNQRTKEPERERESSQRLERLEEGADWKLLPKVIDSPQSGC